MDPATATAQAAAATAASVQTLVNALHSDGPAAATSYSHRLSLSSFWRENPVGWFRYTEAEFVVANLQLNSFLCYSHVLHRHSL